MAKYTPETREELQNLCNDLTVNLGDIDTSKITDMSSLFDWAEGYSDQRDSFKGIESWDVSNVKDMSHMFQRARVENIDFSKWNTANLTDMTCMFAESVLVNVNLNKFNTQNVKEFYACFQDCSFSDDPKISNWDISNGVNFTDMFFQSNYKWDLSSWKINPRADTYAMTYASDLKDSQLPPVYLNRVILEKADFDLQEFQGQIVDIFEDYLDDKKDIRFKNPETNEALEDGELGANIYGSDYDFLAESFTESLTNTLNPDKAADCELKAFSELCEKYEVDNQITVKDLKQIKQQIVETCQQWGFKLEPAEHNLSVRVKR